jgi:uncharacterized membrane protein YuzA (DUF378 family)
MTALAVSIIARLFGVSPAAAQVIAIMVGIAVALGGVWGGYEYIKHQGVVEERTRTDKDNQDAVNKALEAAANFDDCLAAGGMWNFRRQKCGRAETGAR